MTAPEPVRLTDGERDYFRANLRQNLGYRAWVIEDTIVSHIERIVADRLAAERAAHEALREAAEVNRVEAERLRTGLRVLIRDWIDGWEDCTPFDQRDAYRALGDLLGPDYNHERTWLAAAASTPPHDES